VSLSLQTAVNGPKYPFNKNSQWNGETAGFTTLTTTSTSKTHNDWNADTSHMTPHRHWLIGYQPYVVPIKLADNTIVYSEGVGSMVLNPIIDGKKCCPLQFTRVLHVPMLRHNLLSVLFLLNVDRLFVASRVSSDHIHTSTQL
jgi:hypothetical protein